MLGQRADARLSGATFEIAWEIARRRRFAFY
jgi:hypothetical protein